VATRRRTPSARPSRPRRRARTGPSLPRLSPDVTRSIVALVLLVLGVVILVGLLLPGKGALTDWILQVIAPWFGTGRWLLPLVLIGLGIVIERAKGPRAGWGRSVLGATIAYGAILGIIALLEAEGILEGRSGGRIGNGIAEPLRSLVSTPGAFVVLLGLVLVGAVIALDRPVRVLLAPFGRGARDIGAALATPAADAAARVAEASRREPAPPAESSGSIRNGKSARDTASAIWSGSSGRIFNPLA